VKSWRYKAIALNGKVQSGKIEAPSERDAREQLKKKSFLVEAIKEERKLEFSFFQKKIRKTDLSIFIRQLATLLRAGLTVEQAIHGLEQQSDQAELRRVLATLRADVLAGHGLGRAISKQKNIFPEYFSAIVEAAEVSGALPEVMERLAEEEERSVAMRNKIVTALAYPAIVSLVALGVIVFLLAYVVPQIVGVFERNQQEMPWLTEAMISASELIVATWWMDLIFLAVVIYGWGLALRTQKVRQKWHHFLNRLPFLGELRRSIQTARFSKSMAMMLSGGLSVPKAMEYAGASLSDEVFRFSVEDATRRVIEGVAIHRALDEKKIFPPILIQLIASGEISGKLSQTLEQAGIQQERQLESKLAIVTAVLEPILILIMGGAVLLIVLATLDPLIEMNNLVR